MAGVDFEHVEKVYPTGTLGVADLTLGVEDGELLVLVGPSGCGKSTVLRLLAGLETVSHGTLRIGGRIVNDLPPQDRNVAMVFQDYALYPHMSVRRNLEFPLRMRRLPRDVIRRRVEEVGGLLDMGSFLDRLPGQLSGGQRQRAAMGRALVREPAVFLLDEPLSNLDAKLRVQVRAEIEDLQRRTGTTMIYVTHDQVEAMTLGDRVAVLREGRLQQVAAPRALYEEPANVFVAGFIGSPPMNLFAAALAADREGRTTLAVGAERVPITGCRVPAERLHASLGRPLTAGLRPEALHVLPAPAPGSVPAVVLHVELLGHETLAHVRAVADGEDVAPLVARLPGMGGAVRGDRVHLAIDVAELHLFGEDGRSLSS